MYECVDWSPLAEFIEQMENTGSLFSGNEEVRKRSTEDKRPPEHETENEPYKREIVWHNVILFVILHSSGFWGLWQVLTLQAAWQTSIWSFIVAVIGGEGVMVGNHRFFCHKSFKGNFYFKLLAVIAQTIAGQNCVYIWSRDHRLHHKYSDTDADPHNSQRGFFFSHMGWLMLRKHPMVKKMGKNIDMSDLAAEPLVMFQKKYYYFMYAVFGFGIPVFVPMYLWDESFKNALLVAFLARYMVSLHLTWTVNSFAHFYGYRPYSKDIPPVESEFVAFVTSGEGWHNFHHTFPWDYRAGEYGKKWNISAKIVDWFASMGWTYDLRCATAEMIQYRVNKRGDGTHPSKQKMPDDAEQSKNRDTEQSKNSDAESTDSIEVLSEGKISKFGEDDSEDIYGDKVSSEGFTVLKRARASCQG